MSLTILLVALAHALPVIIAGAMSNMMRPVGIVAWITAATAIFTGDPRYALLDLFVIVIAYAWVESWPRQSEQKHTQTTTTRQTWSAPSTESVTDLAKTPKSENTNDVAVAILAVDDLLRNWFWCPSPGNELNYENPGGLTLLAGLLEKAKIPTLSSTIQSLILIAAYNGDFHGALQFATDLAIHPGNGLAKFHPKNPADKVAGYKWFEFASLLKKGGFFDPTIRPKLHASMTEEQISEGLSAARALFDEHLAEKGSDLFSNRLVQAHVSQSRIAEAQFAVDEVRRFLDA